MQSENALRDALAGILEEHFGAQVVPGHRVRRPR
ncbi:MAG: hypothetical protein ACFCVA_17970 [Gammaproteobacteria bacterium]